MIELDPGRCNTSSVGQSAGLSIPRSSVRFQQNPQKTENSNLHGFELHRPSSKGTKLLVQVIQAIINQDECGRWIEFRPFFSEVLESCSPVYYWKFPVSQTLRYFVYFVYHIFIYMYIYVYMYVYPYINIYIYVRGARTRSNSVWKPNRPPHES